MRKEALEYLRCPACFDMLDISEEGDVEPDGHIMTATLSCKGCEERWPVRRGVPRLVHGAMKEATDTATRFAQSWTIFNEIEERYRQQFLDWIQPFGEHDIKGKAVLEGGCGKGRHSRLLGEWGAKSVVGVDLGDAVDVAFANTRFLENVHIVQTDLLRLGVADRFDLAICVGVLHHLPDPQGGFRSLTSKLKPGGRIITWTYGLENNGWIVKVVDPIRKRVTSRLPAGVLLALAWPPALLVWLIGRALSRTGKASRFPYASYLSYIGKFPLREVHHIAFDQLTPPIAYYLPREEIERWYREEGLDDVLLGWHNRNSWRASGSKPAHPG